MKHLQNPFLVRNCDIKLQTIFQIVGRLKAFTNNYISNYFKYIYVIENNKMCHILENEAENTFRKNGVRYIF